MDQLLLENEVFTQKLVTYGHELGQTLGDGEGQGGLVCLGSKRIRDDLATEKQQQWS